MEILFLDIDGVLNSWQHLLYSKDRNIKGNKNLCPIAMANLNYILDTCPKIEIIIHSNWTKFLDLDTVKDILEINGFNHNNRVAGTTPKKLSSNRWNEIRMYLDDHPGEVDSFIILDDREIPKEYSSDCDTYNKMYDNFLLIDQRVGLTFYNVMKIIEHFGEKVNSNYFVGFFGFYPAERSANDR